MAGRNHGTITVLDLPAVLELIDDLLELVPDWERPALQARWDELVANAEAERS